jgi:hypothetical protein
MTPRLLPLLAIWAASASGGTLYLPAYPASVIVFDETKGQIVDHIPLATGAPRAIRLSQDRKKIYVTTIDHDGIEVIDIPTRKVVNHFVLDTPTVQYRFRGGAPEPGGKLFYTVTKEIDRLPEHFEVHDAKYTVIDLVQHKIVKTVEIAREDQYANEAGGPRAAFEFSADGKYLYQFGRSISIFRPADFRLLDRIELAHPDFPGVETLRFGGDLDPISEPGLHVSLFNAADPVVHNKVFGLARFDLGTKQVDFAPIGPAPSGMAGLQVSQTRSGHTPSSRMETTGINAVSSGRLT